MVRRRPDAARPALQGQQGRPALSAAPSAAPSASGASAAICPDRHARRGRAQDALLVVDRRGGDAFREPGDGLGRSAENPRCLGGRAQQSAADPVRQAGHRAAPRPILRDGCDPLLRHAADDFGVRRERDRYRAPRLFVAGGGDRECRHDRSARHRRRVPGRRSGLLHRRIHGAEGQPDPNRRGSEGQDNRLERDRRRDRCRASRDAAPAQARCAQGRHHRRSGLSQHARGAQRAQGRR